MDRHTLDVLEFDKILEFAAARCASELGRKKIRALAPMRDVEAIRLAVDRTRDVVAALDQRMEPPLGGLRDVQPSLRRAELGVLLEVDQLLELRDFLDLTGRAYDYWLRLGADYPKLEALLSDLEDQRHLARSIETVIDAQGKIRDSATPELADIRQQLEILSHKIEAEFRRLLRSPDVRKALRYPQPTMSGDHHVLPVAVNYRHLVVGVVHRASATGETLYIEPAKIAEITTEVTVLRSAELREIRKVLRRLTSMIAGVGPRLLRSLAILAELDFTTAKARFARDFHMSAPEIETNGRLRLVSARHPILLAMREAKLAAAGDSTPDEIVPVTVGLGEDFDLLIVTGPNTGGKTVTLKTVGLLCAMALSGMHIPAQAGSRVPVLTNILADIGDEQSIEQNLSTFSAHMTRIAHVLRSAGPGTLVLLDEMGAGTDPGEGAALGRAILDELSRLECLGIVTTHLGDLKTYALSAKRVENAAVEFDAETLRPTYRLIVGQTGRSCALKIARRLDLPPHLIRRAKHYLRRRTSRRSKEVDAMLDLRSEVQKAREEADAAKADAVQAADELRRKVQLLEQEASISAEIEKFRESLRPGDKVRVVRFDKTGTVVRVDARRKLAAVTVGAVEWRLGLDELLPLPAG
jgi:DNA mismatch repair protein MutS2